VRRDQVDVDKLVSGLMLLLRQLQEAGELPIKPDQEDAA
jgi:hypothetical protein